MEWSHKFTIIVIGLAIWSGPEQLFAAGQGQSCREYQGGRMCVADAVKPAAKVKASQHVNIINSSFRVLPNRQGLWRGYIKGNGYVYLRLKIFRRGKIESTRSIGHVQISDQERPVSFNFKSFIPRGSDWTWSVEATTV